MRFSALSVFCRRCERRFSRRAPTRAVSPSSVSAASGVGHLDGVHPERPGRLEVHTEVVEEHALLGPDAQCLACQLVEAGIWLAHAQHAGLEHSVEKRVDSGDFDRKDRLRPGEVVGETGGLVRHPAGTDRRDHLRPDLSGEPFEHQPPVQFVAQGSGLRRPERPERLHVDLSTLELRPRIGLVIGGVHRADEVDREPAFRLQVGEGLEGARRDHPAEVEHHGSNHCRPPIGRASSLASLRLLREPLSKNSAQSPAATARSSATDSCMMVTRSRSSSPLAHRCSATRSTVMPLSAASVACGSLTPRCRSAAATDEA